MLQHVFHGHLLDRGLGQTDSESMKDDSAVLARQLKVEGVVEWLLQRFLVCGAGGNGWGWRGMEAMAGD